MHGDEGQKEATAASFNLLQTVRPFDATVDIVPLNEVRNFVAMKTGEHKLSSRRSVVK